MDLPGFHHDLSLNDKPLGKLRASGIREVTVGDVAATMYNHARVHWHRSLSIPILTGQSLAAILYPRYVLLRGEHIPLSSPILGVANAVIARVAANPRNLTYLELFTLLFPYARG